MFIERTKIAKKLGISGKAVNRIAYYGKLKYRMINNKRHYDFNEIMKSIELGRKSI